MTLTTRFNNWLVVVQFRVFKYISFHSVKMETTLVGEIPFDTQAVIQYDFWEKRHEPKEFHKFY